MSESSSISIQPLSVKGKQQVIARTEFYIQQAETLFDIKRKLKNRPVEISFKLKGSTAGMYRVQQRKREIRYNDYIFSKFFEDNINVTVPHEVAHYVTDILYGLNKIKPHGEEWKTVMKAFNADASVTANYDLSGIPLKKIPRYTYRCSCQEHELTSIRHNKITKRRYQYYCNTCKQLLQYQPQPQLF